MRRRNGTERRVLGGFAIWLCVGVSGCYWSGDKHDFADDIRQVATRYESRLNPQAMDLSDLLKVSGDPDAIVDLDDSRQQWVYHFRDGSVRFEVQLEPGGRWDEEDPLVFLIPWRIEVL